MFLDLGHTARFCLHVNLSQFSVLEGKKSEDLLSEIKIKNYKNIQKKRIILCKYFPL